MNSDEKELWLQRVQRSIIWERRRRTLRRAIVLTMIAIAGAIIGIEGGNILWQVLTTR